MVHLDPMFDAISEVFVDIVMSIISVFRTRS